MTDTSMQIEIVSRLRLYAIVTVCSEEIAVR
jgi:hypothetical protein